MTERRSRTEESVPETNSSDHHQASPGEPRVVRHLVAEGRRGDGGLAWVLDHLETAGVRYWVDSGVLLGLVRSGSLNAWEKDIDLAVADDQVHSVLELAPAWRAAGYRVSVNRYRGVVFSVGLKPEAPTLAGALRCSIHVYYQVGGSLWSPQVELYQPPPTPDVYRGKRTVVGNLLRAMIQLWFEHPADGSRRSSRIATRKVAGYRLARAFYRVVDRGWLAETWPTREIYASFTWVIPRRLVLPLANHEIGDRVYPVPADVEGYLAYRYGDWRTPVRDWCYWEDDGAIVREAPMAVRTRLAKEETE